jgi:enamine deaminase RidA (YjgF/YER057c/UK114 family)
MPPVASYCHAVRAGQFVFIAGTGSFDKEGKVWPTKPHHAGEDIKKHTKQAIENVRAILNEAGTSLENLVQLTAYMVDMDRDYKGYDEVMHEYFKNSPVARITIQVDKLPMGGVLVAFTGIAIIPD